MSSDRGFDKLDGVKIFRVDTSAVNSVKLFTDIGQFSIDVDSDIHGIPVVSLTDLSGEDIQVGDRVLVLQTAGFHKGAKGEVKYVTPDGQIWVRRDGSSSDVWYRRDELQITSRVK